jgi:hypothetical protein
MTPLSGAELFAPGYEGPPAGSYLLPSLEFTGVSSTNPSVSPGQSNFITADIGLASLSLQSIGRHDQLNLDFSGGGFYYNSSVETSGNGHPLRSGAFQKLSVLPSFNWRRWKLLLGDQATYLPETGNGFYGFGGLTSFGAGLGSGYYSTSATLNPTLAPSQTILTGFARRISNMALTEIDYNVGERSVITATGTYGTLHFLDPGYIDNQIWSFQFGYNYSVSRRSEVGVTYSQSSFRYGTLNQEQLYRTISLAYGYQLTSRLALQLSVGPGASQVTSLPGGAVTKSFVSTFDSLLYRAEKAHAQIMFARYISGGSGVLVGAETDWAGLEFGRELSRRFSGSVNFGYQHNQPLTQESTAQPLIRTNYWLAGGGLNCEMNRYMSFYVNYDFERQISNTPLCFNGHCGMVILRQVGGVGLNFHARPIKIH